MNMAPAAILMGGPRAVLQATALRLARHDLSIILCGSDAASMHTDATELQRNGCSVTQMGVNVADRADLDRIGEAAVQRCGRIAVLVNGPAERPAKVPVDARTVPAHATFDLVALQSCIAGTEVIGAAMANQGGGRIVHLISSAGRYRSAYFRISEKSDIPEAATDGAILAATRQFAFELAARRVRVNAVVAGLIEEATGQAFWESANARDRDFILQEISVGRRGRPDEVAAVVEFLATDASSYITGTAIDVNGGWWMS